MRPVNNPFLLIAMSRDCISISHLSMLMEISYKLPSISSKHSGLDLDKLAPGRRLYMLNSTLNANSTPKPLQLPKLPPPTPKISLGSISQYSRFHFTLPQLTKQGRLEESRDYYSIPKNNKLNKADLSINVSSMNRTFQNFEKSYHSIKGSITEVARKSAVEIVRKKALLQKAQTETESDSHSHSQPVHFTKSRLTSDRESKREGEDTNAPTHDNLTWEKEENAEEDEGFRHSVPPSEEERESLEMHEEEDGIMESANLSTLCAYAATTSPRERESLREGDLHQIMANLTDKEFLTKLKRNDEKASMRIQKMQNHVQAIQQQLENDKRKAKLDDKPEKPLYKPRRKPHAPPGLNSAPGSRQELMDFLQANGGRTGSWNFADHATFLKIYNAWKGIPELIIEKTIFTLKHKTPQEVMVHLKWYEEYEGLMQSKRNEVRKWDEIKKKERKELYEMVDEERKTKIEDEKRRMERLKNIRNNEVKKARERASHWKEINNRFEIYRPDAISQLDPESLHQSIQDFAVEVRRRTDGIIPDSSDRTNPTRLHSTQSREVKEPLFGKTKTVSRSAPSRVRSVPKLLLPDISSMKNPGPSMAQLAIGAGSQSSGSRITDDTLSRKLKKEAQALKRLEIRSSKGRRPNRVEELEIERIPSSVDLLPGSRRGIPNWRKIS